MYRLQIGAVMVEAGTPAEVMALVTLVAGRELQVVMKTPAKATLKKRAGTNGHSGGDIDQRRQRILAALRDRPMLAYELQGVLKDVSMGTLHNDLARLIKLGHVQRGDLGYSVSDPSLATSTM